MKAEAAIDLTRLQDGRSARILSFACDEETISRFEAMGIVAGTVVSKRSSALNRGPVVVLKGGTRLAFAYEIAKAVLVEPIA
jgi:Fe2+ transport system protein FeoA